MNKSKFILLYSGLGIKDQKAFVQYVNGQYPNKKIARLLLKYIVKYQNSDPPKLLKKEKVHLLVFGEKQSKKSRKISNSLSDLYLLLEEFLAWKAFKGKARIEQQFILLELFKDQANGHLYLLKLNEIDRLLEQEKGRGMWYYFYKMRAAHYRYYFTFSGKLTQGGSHAREAMQQLDLFFVSAKMQYSCELYSREKILQEQHDIHFVEEAKVFCEKVVKKEDANIELFYLTAQLIVEREEQLYHYIKKELIIQLEKIQAREQIILLGYLINYTAYMIKKGEVRFEKEAFELYKTGLDKGVFIENGQLSHTRFNNIIGLACKLKQFDWVEEFVSYWQYFLEQKDRKSAVAIAKARILFEQNQFEKAVNVLQKVAFSNIFYTLRARLLLLRCFYELNSEREFVLDYCRSLQVLIKRNQIIGHGSKESFIHFVKAVRYLINRNKQKAEALSMQPMAYRDWIIAKISK